MTWEAVVAGFYGLLLPPWSSLLPWLSSRAQTRDLLRNSDTLLQRRWRILVRNDRKNVSLYYSVYRVKLIFSST